MSNEMRFGKTEMPDGLHIKCEYCHCISPTDHSDDIVHRFDCEFAKTLPEAKFGMPPKPAFKGQEMSFGVHSDFGSPISKACCNWCGETAPDLDTKNILHRHYCEYAAILPDAKFYEGLPKTKREIPDAVRHDHGLFTPGDVVQLKSGGPLMTVQYVHGNDDCAGTPPGHADCAWHTTDFELKRAFFPFVALKHDINFVPVRPPHPIKETRWT